MLIKRLTLLLLNDVIFRLFVALNGVQDIGNALKKKLKQAKSLNVGVILNEVHRRFLPGGGPTLTQNLHPGLEDSGKQVSNTNQSQQIVQIIFSQLIYNLIHH